MAAGEAAAKRAAGAAAAAEVLRLKAEAAERQAERWQRGAAGEQALREALGGLPAVGSFHLLFDRSLPGSAGNIDLLLIGPTGVWIIDAKHWTGPAAVRDGALWQGRWNRTKEVDGLCAQAQAVASAIRPTIGDRRLLFPVICLTGAARVGSSTVVADKVIVTDIDRIRDEVEHRPAVLREAEVEALLAVAVASFPPRTARPTDRPAISASPTHDTSTTVFITGWQKHGKNRLYVTRYSGEKLGYLDLKTGTLEATSGEARGLLTQLLPHYLGGDVPGLSSAELGGPSGLVGRLLASLRGEPTATVAPPVVVSCYRWRKHGLDRLYVSRIQGAQKHDVGWIELDGAASAPADERWAQVLLTCARRAVELDQARARR